MFAHRGASGECPQNTIPAFKKALDDGADILEMDVRSTSEGDLVVFHDPKVDDATDGVGLVSEKTFDDLQEFTVESCKFPACGKADRCDKKDFKISKLEDVLQRFPDTPFNIEIKQYEPRIEIPVVNLLEDMKHAEKTMIASQKRDILQEIRNSKSSVLTSFSIYESFKFFPRAWLSGLIPYKPPGEALQICDLRKLTRGLVKAAHNAGIEVHVWTINEKDDMRRLLKMGVDGIMTDYPGRLTEVVRELGLRRCQP